MRILNPSVFDLRLLGDSFQISFAPIILSIFWLLAPHPYSIIQSPLPTILCLLQALGAEPLWKASLQPVCLLGPFEFTLKKSIH